MKKNIILLVIPSMLLVGCRNSTTTSVPTSSIIPTSSTSIDPTSLIISSSITSITSQSEPTTAKSSAASVPKPTSDSYSKDRNILPIGYLQPDAPTNKPVQIITSLSDAQEYRYSLVEDLPDNWVYIYKNAASNGPTGHHCSANFYSTDSGKPGGLKISDPYIGFQTMRFTHSGEKLELRIKISQINNASDKPEKNKDVSFLYFFDSDGKLIPNLNYTFNAGSIDSKTTELKCYVIGDNIKNVQYFEYWANAKPYKSSQCYNYGIGEITIKSWERA